MQFICFKGQQNSLEIKMCFSFLKINSFIKVKRELLINSGYTFLEHALKEPSS